MVDPKNLDAPDPADVRRALDTMLASETFRGSPQLATFLRFVVEASLRGEADRIKGYTIGVEAFGRPDNFDPQIDPIVRVEATRLRRTLERYYAGPGANDPIIFELSRGSYAPTIRRRESNASDRWRRLPKAWRWPAAIGAAALIALVAFAAISPSRFVENTKSASRDSGGQTFDGPLQPGNGMPALAIPRITVLGMPQASGQPRSQVVFARPLTEKLRAAIASFDTLNVVGDGTEDAVPPGAASAKPGQVDYQLIGSGEFQQDGTIVGRFRLFDVAAGADVWSRPFGPLGPSLNYGPIEDTVVRQLAIALARPFGVIRSNERMKHLAGGARDPRYRCIVEASESFRSFDPAQHARARDCLEALTARDPGFAMGLAYLASVYVREYQYRLGAAPVDASMLDRSLRAALKAIELSPESARAYQMLFTVLFARQDLPAAFAAGDKAMALNPYDVTILSDYGGRLIMSGEVDRGLEVLAGAAEDGAVRPSWYNFYLFLGSYLKNDMTSAARHASQITTESYPLGLLAHALIAAADGNRELARAKYDQLVALRANWRAQPREELGRLFPAGPVIDRLARDLVNGGLVQAR
jgi:tetratricopeptide (TPR) repeat protein/TolB-like protein